jgi:hypothetical protein
VNFKSENEKITQHQNGVLGYLLVHLRKKRKKLNIPLKGGKIKQMGRGNITIF